MGRTACTEPQCLYGIAIPLLPLWAARPVQSLSACTRVHFNLLLLKHYTDDKKLMGWAGYVACMLVRRGE